MPQFELYGAPSFGLRRCKIAVNNLDGTFGTALKVPSIQIVNFALEMTAGELRGDDTITASHAKPMAGTAGFTFGSIDLRVLALILNLTAISSGDTPNRHKRLRITQKDTPFFGIIGQANAAEGVGATVLFIPKVKIISGIELNLQQDNFAIPSFQGRVLGDEYYLDDDGDPVFIEPILYETAPDEAGLTLPPTFV